MGRPRESGDPSVNAGALAHVIECMGQPAVYILASYRNGTLYVGVTSDLARRIEAHRSDAVDSFTRKYGVKRLVYFELPNDMYEAIVREKRIKKWNCAWKIDLIERGNPEWRDLCDQTG